MTESLLYRQIVRFLEEEKIADRFEVAFVSIADGVDVGIEMKEDDGNRKSEIVNLKSGSLPPANFRSGALWVKKAQIEQMATSIVEYLRFKIEDLRLEKSKIKNQKSEIKVIAYVRGSYLEAVRLANTRIRRGSESSPRSSDADQNADPRGDQRSGSAYRSAIIEIFSDEELAQLKKKGIMWMKVGLRMPEAFEIFRRRMKGIVQNNEGKQLKLF